MRLDRRFLWQRRAQVLALRREERTQRDALRGRVAGAGPVWQADAGVVLRDLVFLEPRFFLLLFSALLGRPRPWTKTTL